MFSNTFMESKSAPSWNDMPNLRRIARQTRGVGAREVLAVHDDVPAVRLDEADQVLEQDALAGARAADDDERLAGHDLELDAAQHLLAAERLPEVDDGDLGDRLSDCRRRPSAGARRC